ncbi:MAG: hypothetical protein J7L47_03450 [Candidatus Odinarchaeota archaeon]|nr:hypothetical protein [Candidatus Odinarchaeota archaeon]
MKLNEIMLPMAIAATLVAVVAILLGRFEHLFTIANSHSAESIRVIIMQTGELSDARALANSAKFYAMAIAVSVAALASAYAVAKTGTAALASITEKPELFGRAIAFVGLAEGIAIYGLLVALLLWITHI